MEDSLYDEFGNYIGPDPTGDEDDHDESDDDERWMDELRPADQEGASANGHMEVAGTYLVHGGPGYHSRSLLYSVTPPLRDIARSLARSQRTNITRSLAQQTTSIIPARPSYCTRTKSTFRVRRRSIRVPRPWSRTRTHRR